MSETKEAKSSLLLKDFSIGAFHTFSLPNYENFKIEARITCGVKIGSTDEEFRATLKEAQDKLKEILRDLYVDTRRKSSIQARIESTEQSEPDRTGE